uniref:Large ribosomal subunit protein uL15 n=1 Tax=Catharus ustulatus TaxID=91951 RepID=A0A8C3Y086_CATUS
MHTQRKHPRGHGNNAGGMQHHRMNFNKHHSGYFRKVGTTHCHLKRNQKFCATINSETGDLEVNRKGRNALLSVVRHWKKFSREVVAAHS